MPGEVCRIIFWYNFQIVVSKLRAQTVMEYDYKHWKAAKALIVVIPLLGKCKKMQDFSSISLFTHFVFL
jgi:hypothetical protein